LKNTKKAELKREKLAELEKYKKAELKREKLAEFEKYKLAELEKFKMAELEKYKAELEKEKPISRSEFLASAHKLRIQVDDSATVTAHPCSIGNMDKFGWQVKEDKFLDVGLSKPVKTRITVKIEVIE